MFAKVWNIFWKVMKINFDKIRDMFLQSLCRTTWTRKHPIPSTFLTPFCSTSVAQASWYDATAVRPGRPNTETANHSPPWSHHRPPFRRPSGRWPTKTTGCRLGPVWWNIVFYQMVLRLSSATPRKRGQTPTWMFIPLWKGTLKGKNTCQGKMQLEDLLRSLSNQCHHPPAKTVSPCQELWS